MDHRTTSQEASPNGHQKAESAAAAKCPHGFPRSLVCGYCKQPSELVCLGPHYNNAVAILPDRTEELKAAYEQIAKLEAALDECIDYFEDRADADCDQDGYIPNEEMKMLGRINETLHGPGCF